MTRLQKKCFVFSLGLHGTLIGILVVSSAFRSQPKQDEMPILTLIPTTITDTGTAGGGGPAMTVAPKPAPAPVQPQQAKPVQTALVRPPKPVTEPPKPIVHEETPEPIVPVHHKPTHTPEPEPTPRELSDDGIPAPRPKRKPHVIQPTFDEVTPGSSRSRKHVKPNESSEESAQAAAAAAADASARASARRAAIGKALGRLAHNVVNDGAPGTAVDMPGAGGGESFVSYKTFIYNRYFHAWAPPDSIANKLAAADVKIVVARDGRILSSEIINRSGEPALDKSVERALRTVTELPPFPADAKDEQRSFLLRFDLEAKEGSG